LSPSERNVRIRGEVASDAVEPASPAIIPSFYDIDEKSLSNKVYMDGPDGQKFTIMEVDREKMADTLIEIADSFHSPASPTAPRLRKGPGTLHSLAQHARELLLERVSELRETNTDASGMTLEQLESSIAADTFEEAVHWISPGHITNRDMALWVLDLSSRDVHGPLRIRHLLNCIVLIRGKTVGIVHIAKLSSRRFKALAPLSCVVCWTDLAGCRNLPYNFFTGDVNVSSSQINMQCNKHFAPVRAVQCTTCSSLLCTSCCFNIDLCAVCRKPVSNADLDTVPCKDIAPHLCIGGVKLIVMHYADVVSEGGVSGRKIPKRLFRVATRREHINLKAEERRRQTEERRRQAEAAVERASTGAQVAVQAAHDAQSAVLDLMETPFDLHAESLRIIQNIYATEGRNVSPYGFYMNMQINVDSFLGGLQISPEEHASFRKRMFDIAENTRLMGGVVAQGAVEAGSASGSAASSARANESLAVRLQNIANGTLSLLPSQLDELAVIVGRARQSGALDDSAPGGSSSRNPANAAVLEDPDDYEL
jgi:hypothetical protein